MNADTRNTQHTPTRRALTDVELWQCLSEAEQRKSDSGLPIDARIRSFETYAVCLREADNRGYSYATLKAKAIGSAS